MADQAPPPPPGSPDETREIGPFVDDSPSGGRLTVVLVILGFAGFVAAAVYGYLHARAAGETLGPVSPVSVRPAATADFDETLRPLATPESPRDPRFTGSVSGLTVGAADPARGGGPDDRAMRFTVIRPSSEFVPAYEIVRLDEHLAFSLGDEGSGHIEWIAAATLEESRFDPDKNRLSLSFFEPDLTPIPESDLEDRGIDAWKQQVHARATEPGSALRARLVTTGLEDPDWRFRGAFDSATHARLSRGGSWTSEGPTCEFTTDFQIFHPAPLTLVLDASHGPLESFEMEATEGAVFDQADLPFTVRLLSVVDGTYSGHSVSGGSPADVEFRLNPAPEEKPMCLVPLVVSPEVFRDAVSIEVVTTAGETLEGRRTSTAGIVQVVGFECAAADIARVRLSYRPHWKRFLIDLPRLPGTPAANDGLADLLEVTVPWGEIGDEHQLRRLIGGALELEVSGSSGGSSWGPGGASPFPMEIRGESIADLVQRHRDLFPDTEIRLDPAAGRIEFDRYRRRPWLARLLGL